MDGCIDWLDFLVIVNYSSVRTDGPASLWQDISMYFWGDMARRGITWVTRCSVFWFSVHFHANSPVAILAPVPPEVNKFSSFPTGNFSPAFFVFCFLDLSRSDQCEIESKSRFNLSFPDG